MSSYSNYKKSQAPVVKQPRQIREWSEYQKAIFNDIANGKGNTQVIARAGTGKTSTLVEGFYYIPKEVNTLFCAFNKSIATELNTRAPEGVDVKTLHALGFAACKKAFPKAILDTAGDKLRSFCEDEKGTDPETYDIRSSLMKAVPLCKGFLASTKEEIGAVLDSYDIDICEDENMEASREAFIMSVMRILNACKKDTNRIDFDDMIWIPNVHNLRLFQYGMVFIDEAQDLNPAQINLALKSVKPNGRIISVGDPAQSIYKFRGADSNAIDNIIERTSAKKLSLCVSYRCCKSVIELCQTLVPDIQAAPNASDGLVSYIGTAEMEKLAKPGCFIISRINAPLMKICLSFLKAGIPANIKGRDVGANLVTLIKKSKKKNVDAFLEWLDNYREMEMERLAKSNKDSSTVEDKVECLRALCEGCKSLAEVKNNIEKLFSDSDDKNRIMCMSIHKSKGLEAQNCFVLKDTLRVGRS